MGLLINPKFYFNKSASFLEGMVTKLIAAVMGELAKRVPGDAAIFIKHSRLS